MKSVFITDDINYLINSKTHSIFNFRTQIFMKLHLSFILQVSFHMIFHFIINIRKLAYARFM